MLKLNFNLRHQAITLLNPGTIVATDSKNYLVANFNFISDDWEYPLTAVFTSDVEKIPYTILVGQSEELEENECFIPWEVLQSSGNVYVSVFCGDLHTTNTVKFKVVKSGYTEGEIPPPPTPTIYEQILQALDNKQPMLTAGENITITEENVISASSVSNDYTDLINKPSINNVTLSGNKSGDDLNLQGKLTAGNNITIESNVISAKGGGVTSYNDLTDKPTIDGKSISGNINLSQGLRFYYFPNWGENGYRELSTDTTNLLNKIVELTNDTYNRSNIFGFQTRQVIKNFLPNNKRSVVFQFYTDEQYVDEQGTFRQTDLQFYIDFSIETGEMFFRTVSRTNNQEVVYGDWEKINKTIVSGVVNADGTITFTDSEGNSFTTSGESVIGNYTLTEQDKQDIADIVIQKMQGSD